MTPVIKSQVERIVLIVDDDPSIVEVLSRMLSSTNRVLTTSCVLDAEAVLRSQPVQVILCDHHLEGEQGLSFLTRLAKSHPAIQRILVTGDVNVELLMDSINKGQIFRFLVKPLRNSDVTQTVEEALAEYRSFGYRKSRARFRLNMANVTKLLGLAFFGLFLVFIAILLLGTLAFLLLYLFKSAIGIDLLPNTHLPDLL